MKNLVAILLFIGSSAFAAQDLLCTFDGPITLKGQINADKSLTVLEVSGNIIINNPTTTDDINNNPVPRENADDGRSKYSVDALSSDPDYGNVYKLYVPAELAVGTNPANLDYVYYSRSPESHYLTGQCTLSN